MMKKKKDVSLGIFCKWSYKSTKKWNKKISWHPSFPDIAKIPALTWSRRGRECSLFLQHTEMQGVFVFCFLAKGGDELTVHEIMLFFFFITVG